MIYIKLFKTMQNSMPPPNGAQAEMKADKQSSFQHMFAAANNAAEANKGHTILLM